MESYYKDERNLQKAEVLVGNKYLVKQEGLWQRVEVLSIEENRMLCFFLDHGDSEYFFLDQVYVLQARFLTVAYQAFRCRLLGLSDYLEYSALPYYLNSLISGEVLVASVDVQDEDVIIIELYDTKEDDSVSMIEKVKELVMEDGLAAKLPSVGGITEVYLSHTAPTGDLYIRLKRHSLVEKYLIDEANERCEKTPSPKVLNTDSLYIAKYSDNNWYRTRVLTATSQEQIEVFSVDDGRTDEIPMYNIRELEHINSIMCSLPYQAINCTLHGIPPNGKLKWTSYAQNRLTALAPQSQPLLLKVVQAAAEEKPAVVELFKRLQPLNELVSINQTLAFDMEPKEPTPCAKSLRNTIRSGSGDSLTDSTLDETGDTIEPDPLAKSKLFELPISAEIGGHFDVVVRIASSPSNFVCAPWETYIDLEKQTEAMQNYYSDKKNKPGLASRDITVNELYAVNHPTEKMWYRGEVRSRNKEGTVVSVYFMDFGDILYVSCSNLQPLPEQFRSILAQAFFCKLSGVASKNGSNDWLPEDVVRFQALVVEKEFVARLLEKTVDNNNVVTLAIDLTDTSDKEFDVVIKDLLISEGRAIPT